MISRNARHELCCLAATCLCVGTFMLVAFALDYAAGDPVSPLRLPLMIAAGVAFVLMIAFVAIAIRMEPVPAGGRVAEAKRRQRPPRLTRHTGGQQSVPRPGT